MIMIASSCKTRETENPFFKTWDTPFQVPPFELIQNEHFLPAFQKGISQQEAEIEAIVSSTEAPDFGNTLEALENSGLLLSKVSSVFYNLLSSLTNDELQDIAKEVSPLLSAHYDNINLNPDLFARIQAVYEKRENLDLNPEQTKLLEETYKRFVRGGAALEEDKQERFREINQRLSILTLQFGDNVLAETNRFQLVIEREADLAGLPQAIRDAAAESARNLDLEGKWVFTLHGPSLWPFLQYAENRELREKMQTAYANRGNNDDEFDNKAIISEIVSLRLERAKMLGFSNHAEFILAERMAKNPETVDAFLQRLWTPSLEMARKEAAEFQEMINREGKDFQLQAWDWWFYAEKLRKEKFDLEEEVLRPYFELESVKQGIFQLCDKLYGLQFVPQIEIPAYHKDVQVYEVTEEDGTHIGIIYMDFFPRASKRGGAWMSSFREQSVRNGEFIHPVVTINGNFSRPVGDQPALLSYDEMLTFFHEFGHALHGLLANTTYPSLSGTNVTWDFVELPSQIMENWASDPEFLKLFARHYQTGEAIPHELLNKLKESSLFNQGFANTEYLAASILDMNFHSYEGNETIDVANFEKESMATISLIPEIIPRYRSTYFSHIFSGGYSAGYYSYRWAEVLDSDAYEAFKENGLFDRETASRFRKFILEKGGTEDPMELYVQFRGRKPDEKSFLKKRGLL
jgi:peptidyl-dipeptidase Dcp